MMMLIWIKQHLSIIWSSIDEKIKQHRDWVEKKLIEKRVFDIDWKIQMLAFLLKYIVKKLVP